MMTETAYNGNTAPSRRVLIWSMKLILAGIIIVLLARHISVDALFSTIRSADSFYLIAALLLLLPNLGLQYRKWEVLLRKVSPSVTSADVRSSLFAGFTLGIVTPARIGEFGGRAIAFRGMSRTLLVGLTALDKGLTMVVTILVGLAGFISFAWIHDFGDPLLLSLAGVPVFLFTTVIAILIAQGKTTALRSRLRDRKGKLASLCETMAVFNRRDLGFLLLLSVLFYCTFVTQFLLLLAAFGPIDPMTAILGISSTMLFKTVIPPVTLGELGIRESASVYFLGFSGIVAASAFSASLLLFVINLLLPSLAGLFYLTRIRGRATARGAA